MNLLYRGQSNAVARFCGGETVCILLTELCHHPKPLMRNVADDDVYINPNLSKAESKAAYVERCRRRLAAQRRGELRESSGQSSGRRDRSVNNNHISRDNANRSQVAATSRSSLNPTASEFTASGLRDTRSGM